ncbi:hybrid sensor histidine kinase/response regulator transcription factor [Bacteroides salyersiae]|uniref:hybrid sensor histidine kinase/response regulator transcription factor n=1 Tax=Bacteroides salyersiae TaxID=291644 RepID=UPI001C8C3B5A|nr:hybrid sensor histidine kinase/response regulator transcription factor [Bacteroides salyersiae]
MKNLLLGMTVFLSLHLHAQNYYIKQLDIEQGLSNNSVISITQDRDGFLWFATEEGLNKFDGNRFINYYKHMNRLSGNELNCVYADPQEPIIWIATQRAGMNAYNYEKDELTIYVHENSNPASLITNDVTRIFPASDGNLWFSTYYRGVEYFNKQTQEFTHYNTETVPELPSDNTWTVMDDGNGQVYIGHVGQGLSIVSLKNKHVKNFKHIPGDNNSIPGNHVNCVYKDNTNNIWIGTDRGAALFNPETEQFFPIRYPVGNQIASNVFDIRQMDNNKIWIAAELNGISIIDLKQHFFMSPEQLSMEYITVGSNNYSLSNSTVRCIFQDSFKNIWIGTYGGGINFIGHTPPLFNTHSYSPIKEDQSSLNNRTVLSLCTDSDNNLWIGTDGGGINLFEKNKRIAIFNEENRSINHNSVISQYRDSQGNIWIGTFFAGVNFYNSHTKRFERIDLEGSPNYDARCFYEDNRHNIWIGSTSGIFVIDINTHKCLAHYTAENSPLPENTVRSIVQDAKGRIWVGTFGQGLSVYTTEMQPIGYFQESNGFCSNSINHIFRDSHNQIWVATGNGLVCFSANGTLEYQVYGRKEGIYNSHIRAITEDNESNIWFSTNAGISCFIAQTKNFINYNYFDKTPMGNFTNASVARDRNGIIYFGSINGARYFDPQAVLSKREVAPVVITEMRIYEGQPGSKGTSTMNLYGQENPNVQLNYKQNTFNLTFNVQDYSQANLVDYTYRLKGLDDSWYTVNENSVMFRNIPPGHYEFQLKARFRNQEWLDTVNTLPIHITPPIWLSWWAKTCYFILAGCIIFYLLYLYKKKVDVQSSYELEKKNHEQEQELNNERLRFYTNITHELRTPLTLILGPLEDLQQDTELLPRQHKKISVIHNSAIRLLNLINQILEFRKTETQNKKLRVCKENLSTLITEIGLRYKELNRKENIKFKISVESDPISLYFDREIITMILDNLISNAIKYTEKGEISISLYTVRRSDTDYVEIKVSDTGQGISPDELPHIFDRYYQAKSGQQASGTGIGLALVKNLVKLHEGEIHAESNEGSGTSFYFSLIMHNIYPNALHADPEEIAPKKEEIKELEVPSEETASASAEPSMNEKPILLIVEDNADICEYISESFSESFEVVTAGEGEAGCNTAFTHIPDIIVTDIMMPGMDGIAFCKIIKEDVRTSHIPVIMLTAKDSIQNKEEGYMAGADSYLTKPFSASLLRSRIHNLLDSRKKLAKQFSANLNVVSDKSITLHESLNQLDNEFMQKITQIIEDNLDSEKIDVTYLADKLYMSKSTLYRKVKALTGISTNEYVRKIKMQNAEKLILEGRYTISEIAFRVGMNSAVYFRQCFKEEFGVSPSEFLKKLKGEPEK